MTPDATQARAVEKLCFRLMADRWAINRRGWQQQQRHDGQRTCEDWEK